MKRNSFLHRNEFLRITISTGCRGLRAIIEKVMKRVMFEVPSMPEVTKCIVNRESVLSTGEPILKNEADQDIQLQS